MNKFAMIGFRGDREYQDSSVLMQRMADAATNFEQAWMNLELAAQAVKSRIPEEYGTIAEASLQTWQVWQSFERTCQSVADIESKVLKIQAMERRAYDKESECEK